MVATDMYEVSHTVIFMTTTHLDHINHSNGFATRWTTWENEGLPNNLAARLRAIGTYSESAVALLIELTDELEANLTKWSPAGAVDRFICSTDDWTERLNRWACVRALECLDRLPCSPLPRPQWCPPEPNLRRRTFTDVEIGLVRHCSLGAATRAGAVGALDAGAASGELHGLTPTEVRRDDRGAPTHLEGKGTVRDVPFGYPTAAARTLEIPAWAGTAFATLVAHTEPTELLLYSGNSNENPKIQSSILMGVKKVLTQAGLGDDPTVKPISIRNTAARRVYESGGIEAAARFLGHDDWMSVAKEIGIRKHLSARKR